MNGTFRAIAQAVMRFKRPRNIMNDYSDIEWRLAKAVELGYKLAIGEMVGTMNKNGWK